MDAKKIRSSLERAAKSLVQALPILLGVLLLISLVIVLVPPSFYGRVFTGDEIFDPLLGATLGSIAAGNPINSYIIGGELMDQGVSTLAVTAFIVAWVTVGLIHIPAESLMLGRRFAFIRNGVCFASAVIIALLMTFTLKMV
jgi:uncharacterized membrane protein YraQ (UPF0718 family)